MLVPDEEKALCWRHSQLQVPLLGGGLWPGNRTLCCLHSWFPFGLCSVSLKKVHDPDCQLSKHRPVLSIIVQTSIRFTLSNHFSAAFTPITLCWKFEVRDNLSLVTWFIDIYLFICDFKYTDRFASLVAVLKKQLKWEHKHGAKFNPRLFCT